MALKFSTTPVKRKLISRRKLVTKAAPRVIKQDYAIDQFGELASRKRTALAAARKLGHDMMPWHQRTNDPAGRWNSFCGSCNKAMVVCTEAPEHLPEVYGPALKDECPVTIPAVASA